MNETQQNELFRKIPSVDEILSSGKLDKYGEILSREHCVRLVRMSLEEIRRKIISGAVTELDSGTILEQVKSFLERFLSQGQRRIVNATGIIIHTNLGRSLLPGPVIRKLEEVSAHYTDLEFDFTEGVRGHRNRKVDWLLTFLTGAEDAFAVNNNAAAVFLCLNALAKGKEVIISRGELIEIGGGFRIPEVMENSGCILKEVGTTNKTKLQDYRQAINEKTALITKVHTSNYRIVGFTEEPSLEELVKLGNQFSIPVLHDLGSGKLFDVLSAEPFPEPSAEASIKAGVDLVTFSGDKYLGGCQAGIILGDSSIMKILKKHPIARAVRLDKIMLAALEATLRMYLDPDNALQEIPTLAMMHLSLDGMMYRLDNLFKVVSAECLEKLQLRIEDGFSQLGGGSLPMHDIPTLLLGLHPDGITAEKIALFLRNQTPPIVGRIQKDTFYLDLRTVLPDDMDHLVSSLENLAKTKG